MTLIEAKEKDSILTYLRTFARPRFINDAELQSRLKIDISSVVHYGREMEALGYLQSANSYDGWSFRIQESGIHFINNGGFSDEYIQEVAQERAMEAERKDERLTRKVSRRTSRGSIAISILAFLVAVFALLAQILDWFTTGN